MNHGKTLQFWCNEITRGVSRSTGTNFQAKRPSFGAQNRAQGQKSKTWRKKSTGNSLHVPGALPGIPGGPPRRFRQLLYIFFKVANFHILDHILQT